MAAALMRCVPPTTAYVINSQPATATQSTSMPLASPRRVVVTRSWPRFPPQPQRKLRFYSRPSRAIEARTCMNMLMMSV